MAKFVPRSVGVQVSRGDYTQISSEGVLRKAEATDRDDPARVVPSEGCGVAGRALHARPYPHVPEHSAQVQCGPHDRISEGQECGADSSRSVARASDDRAEL